MDTAARTWRTIRAWYVPGTAQGVLGLQLLLNSVMLTAIVLLAPAPWLALAALAVLFVLTLRLHARHRRTLIALFGAIGWIAEAWLVGAGGVWAFTHPADRLSEGGLFGVPFYMLPGWALVGALMLALSDWMDRAVDRS